VEAVPSALRGGVSGHRSSGVPTGGVASEVKIDDEDGDVDEDKNENADDEVASEVSNDMLDDSNVGIGES